MGCFDIDDLFHGLTVIARSAATKQSRAVTPTSWPLALDCFAALAMTMERARMRLTLRQLEVFVAIARDGNVTHAADRISMSQSAASTALGELEKQFGRPLFDR